MAGFADIPRSTLIALGNSNRVKAMSLKLLQPEMGLLLKVRFQRGASGVFLIPPAHAIAFAEPIRTKAKSANWAVMEPPPATIDASEESGVPGAPDGGNVFGGHILVLDDAVILVFGIEVEKNLAQCLRVGRNHAAWLAEQILDARDRQLLKPTGSPDAIARPN